ncbi:Ig-like domain-containing protein [Caenimonas sp. SL110]|uniref:Ig-like domain-containing protein n=1 Tax=Caenimonas sp. SL110 TaxID=1450524 RepID=UPI000652953E|nr:Ig-like domain-containing protein [Caenimonas sp. SL110]
MLKLLVGVFIAAVLAACGGGGGSSGTTPGGGTSAQPTITLELQTAAGASTTVVNNITTVSARATVRNSSGTPIAGQVVTFTQEGGLARFVPAGGTALTDANGVATVQILPASSTSAGAGTLKAETVVGTATVSTSLSFSVPLGSSDTATSRVTNFALLLDRSTLPNSGASTVKLTVVAVDANNNVVPGATVTVATDANTVYVPGGTVTNAQGEFTGTISIGSDKNDRAVTVTVTVNGIVKQTSFQIVGSQLELTMSPPVLAQGAASTVTARLTDSAGSPITGKTVSFSGDIASINGRSGNTDATGTVVLSFTAPAVAGSYIVRAAASGITKQTSAQVGASNVIPNAVIPFGAVPSLAASPNVLAPNTSGSTASQSQLRFLALTAANEPIPNVRVRFFITSTGLGSTDSTISTGTSTVYTNASGVATAAFIPGSTGSPTDGITITACYDDKDFVAPGCGPRPPVTARLTIAAQALAVSIGNDNLLTKGDGTYIKQFVVTVADAAGRAVPNALVDISLDITHYGKGLFAQSHSFLEPTLDPEGYVPNKTITPADYGSRVSCINEDRNRNGFVDAGDNTNTSRDSFGQETLEPRRSDIILSYVAGNTTNASGILLIKVEYSQRYATWLHYRIRGTTNVAGSQGSVERSFITSYVIGDDEAGGSFLTAPYGASSCNSPN